jgi:hypothetical protein
MSLFSAFIAALRLEIWPAGEAKTLRPAHTGYIKAAMTDIQKWVPQLQVNNTSTYARCDRFWEDAKSVVEAPIGELRRVYTIVSGEDGGEEWRDKVFYDSSNFEAVERWAKRLITEAVTPPNTGLPALSRGFRYEEASVDSAIGRARKGAWAIWRKNLYVVPWLQSNELLVLEWDGVKSVWADSDVVDDEIWTEDVREAVSFYVKWKHECFFGAGPNSAEARAWKAQYDERVSDLMITWRDRTKQQKSFEVPEAVTHLTVEQIEDDADPAADADTPCPDLPDAPPGETPSGVGIFSGLGSPEGSFAAGVGSIYTDITDPEHPVTWKKTSGGYTNTGWVQEIAI